jgi:LPS O-antigen subunit length determinant protein (WzzB/FepE family)
MVLAKVAAYITCFAMLFSALVRETWQLTVTTSQAKVNFGLSLEP